MKLMSVAFVMAILLESTISTLPLVLLLILFLAVIKRTNDIFVVAFFSGLFLDFLTFGRFGISSLYFTIFVFLIYSYQKRFEIETLHFVALFSFFGSLFYLLIQGHSYLILQSVISMIILVSSFIAFKKYNKKAAKYA